MLGEMMSVLCSTYSSIRSGMQVGGGGDGDGVAVAMVSLYCDIPGIGQHGALPLQQV